MAFSLVNTGEFANGTVSSIQLDNAGNQTVNVVSGSVSVTNFPVTQTVNGSIIVSSLTGGNVNAAVSGSVSVTNFPATQPVSGTVTANAGSGNFTVVQSTGTNLHTVIDSGTVTAIGTLTDNNAAPTSNNLGVLPAVANYASPVKTQGDLGTLSTDLQGYLRIRNRSESTLGDMISSPRYNQIEINFSQAFNAALITNTLTTTGTAVQANGCATYSTGTGAAGEAKGSTVQVLEYRPGHEWYCYFTASFSTPAASSYQRIGPYSTTDGFYIGYEGTTFNFTNRDGSSDTHVARSSWNGDAATGSAGSAFTSSGSPVALNFQMINIYRIHGAWFGVAPISLEVFSPDGEWVVLHTFRYPNTLTAPYANTTTWNVTVDVANTGNTSNLSVTTACWAMGVTDITNILTDSLTDNSLVQTTRSVIAGKTPSGSYAQVGITAQDALTVGGSGATSVAAATWTTSTGSQISPVGGSTNDATTNVTTLTVTYSPTASSSHCAVVSFNTGGAYTGLAVKDNNNNVLTAGPTIGNLAMFYQFPVPASVTGYTATWTTGRQASLAVEEYSGVNTVDSTLAGDTASGSSATASITATPDEGGDVVVCALGVSVGNSLTGTVGSTRQNVIASTARQILMDSTAVPAICTATLTSSAWNAVAIGLRPTIISGTALNTTLLMVNNSFSYNSVAVEVVGTGTIVTGTITSEVSIDNTNWINIPGVVTGTGAAETSPIYSLTATTTGLIFNITGYNYFRFRLSTGITGYLGQVVISYNVQGLASPSVSSTITNGSITVNDNQGTPNTLTNAWPHLLTDTVNGPVAVKPPNTSVLATDSSLVVAVSPNSYVPALNATNQISVANTATLIIAANASRQGVLITNPSSSVTVYVGTASVTTSNGAILGPSQSIFLPMTSAFYGIISSSTQTVSYLEAQ